MPDEPEKKIVRYEVNTNLLILLIFSIVMIAGLLVVVLTDVTSLEYALWLQEIVRIIRGTE